MTASWLWLRVVLPPRVFLGLGIFVYLTLESVHVLEYFVKRWFGDVEWQQPCVPLIAIGSLALGMFRAVYFHPIVYPDYRQWLESTPWASRQPLPLGPVYLVWQDVIVVGIISAVCLLHRSKFLDPLGPPLAFLLSYVAVQCVNLIATGHWQFSYVIGWGFGLVAWLAPDVPTADGAVKFENEPIALAVAVVLYGVAHLGLRRSLADFPWRGDEDAVRSFARLRLQSTSARGAADVGWPFNLLNCQRPKLAVPLKIATLISLLGGWWLYAGLVHLRPLWSVPDVTEMVWFVYIPFVVACVIIRIGVYMVNYWPPISFLGRILTLRWIIPGYDRIFVAPWTAVLVGVMLPVALSAAGLEPHIAAPVSASCVLWLVLTLGPTLESWRFTGSFRLAGFFNKQAFSHT